MGMSESASLKVGCGSSGFDGVGCVGVGGLWLLSGVLIGVCIVFLFG